MRIHQ